MSPIRILSFGEVLFDSFGDTHMLGGAPLNLAAHAALAGAEVYLASAVGYDELGEKAVEGARALGVKTDHVTRVAEKKTGQCLVTLGEDGSPTYRLLSDVAYDYIAPPEGEESFDVLAFGTLALRGEHNRRTLEEILAAHSFDEVFTDLNIRAPFFSEESIRLCLSAATIVKISDEELPTVTRTLFGESLDPDASVARIGAAYPRIRLFLITLGERGSLCYTGERRYEMPITPTTAVSTVGAGDSFGATFLVRYLATRDIPAALRAASVVAAFVVAHRGAVPDGMRAFLKGIRDPFDEA